MRMIEIVALSNGAHYNQSYHGFLPDGWAVIPDDLETENFPFGEVTVEDVDGVPTVTGWTPGILPEPEPENEPEPEPTYDERIKALEDNKANQTAVDELSEALELLLSGDTGEEVVADEA